jgi:hypothetical protein
MDRVWIFMFLGGMSTLIGLMLSTFWTHLAYCRARLIAHPKHKDRTFVLAASIATLSAGVTVADGWRTWGNIEYGLSESLRSPDAYFVAAGLVIAILGMVGMVWLADLEKHPPRWTWLRTMIGVTVLWAVISALLAPGVPWYG